MGQGQGVKEGAITSTYLLYKYKGYRAHDAGHTQQQPLTNPWNQPRKGRKKEKTKPFLS